ncbi:Leucine carboxyl methyltransferase [Streptomyces sp. YIM 130001]|uniref:class I SAM-dependent methyltransferase n=1 Tax=Streptomyces sp. YIM 130001 TaxID=2259644 RepID=UPI000E64EAB7|nr:class I SAM-dependent methyltransferase [Streptomyces sp. YIM 130001]RII20400.1 Leucine carboxyl methyltransferase [Streptomyces sp. YIM 130001]
MTQPKRKPELGAVQETLLIPLYGRAVQTRKRHGMIDDPQAVRMVDGIDYDFSRFDGAKSLLGATLRTLLFDVWAEDFLRRHPSGTVVELGTGLNTRFDRLDNGSVHWFDLDLPDVIALRRRYFEDTERRRMLPVSVTDPSWADTVADSPGPYLVLAEAVLIYLPEEDVESVFRLIDERLPGATVALETSAPWMVERQDRHDVLGDMEARIRWSCADPRDMETWVPGLRLAESRTLARLPAALRRSLPLRYRLLVRAMGAVRLRDIEAYRFNLFRLEQL